MVSLFPVIGSLGLIGFHGWLLRGFVSLFRFYSRGSGTGFLIGGRLSLHRCEPVPDESVGGVLADVAVVVAALVLDVLVPAGVVVLEFAAGDLAVGVVGVAVVAVSPSRTACTAHSCGRW